MNFIKSIISTWLILTSTFCNLNIILAYILINKYTSLFQQSEVRRGACKCGSTTHSRTNHRDCQRNLKRRPTDVESIQSPTQRRRLSTPSLTNLTPNTYQNSPLTLINRTIQSLHLNSTQLNSNVK